MVSIMEHHSNMLPWQMVARQTGAKLIYLECEKDGSLSEAKLDEAFSDKTRLVAITQVSNVLGRPTPVEEIVRRARKSNAVVVLDAAQSSPHMPIDVQKLDVDFLAFSGHKLMGPMGIGVLYGKKKLLKAMPPFLTGGEMIDSVTRDGANMQSFRISLKQEPSMQQAQWDWQPLLIILTKSVLKPCRSVNLHLRKEP